MKSSDKDKPIRTIPSGVWEGNRPSDDKDKRKCTVSTDLQGNGYPQKQGK